MSSYVGAIDQGTTSTRFIVFDRTGRIISITQREHEQIYPKPGWVEHDPEEIWKRTQEVIAAAMESKGLRATELAAIGITNQRETTILWNRKTGRPVYNAIVWQDTRVEDAVAEFSRDGGQDRFRRKTGLPLATYFSALKLRWILNSVSGVREQAEAGDVIFGNVDTFLTWKLTGGPNGGVHVTDVTNASRTQLMNLETLSWDREILDCYGIPEKVLPRICSSSETYGLAQLDPIRGVPIAGILGDQQAALVGQACFNPGEAKNTYGTGCFLLMNTGAKPIQSRHGLITTVAYKIGELPAHYSLEGSVAISGALVQWLRDNLGIIGRSSDIEALARTVTDNGGVYFVPAFSGLYAPYWKATARGVIAGLTRYVNKGHLARAVFEPPRSDPRGCRSDGARFGNSLGHFANRRRHGRQRPADAIPGRHFESPRRRAGDQGNNRGRRILRRRVGGGFFEDTTELRSNWTMDHRWEPCMDGPSRESTYRLWKKAVRRSFDWVD